MASKERISILANLAVILGFLVGCAGLIFAYLQISQQELAERKRVAIEAVNQARSPDFLRSLARLKTTSVTRSKAVGVIGGQKSLIEENEERLTDDINYATNVYGHIAVLYLQNLADKCIIKKSCHPAIKELSELCGNTLQCPSRNKKDIDEALRLMDQEPCR